MPGVLLFHHAQGQTSGFLAFADQLRDAGRTVHAPDPYDGRTFATLEGGPTLTREVLPAQSLAQTGLSHVHEN